MTKTTKQLILAASFATIAFGIALGLSMGSFALLLIPLCVWAFVFTMSCLLLFSIPLCVFTFTYYAIESLAILFERTKLDQILEEENNSSSPPSTLIKKEKEPTVQDVKSKIYNVTYLSLQAHLQNPMLTNIIIDYCFNSDEPPCKKNLTSSRIGLGCRQY